MAPLALRADLDALRCDVAGCDCDEPGVVIASRCHEDAPMWATYNRGELRLTCAECGADVVTIAVAA